MTHKLNTIVLVADTFEHNVDNVNFYSRTLEKPSSDYVKDLSIALQRHCKYTGIKWFVNLTKISHKYQYMITKEAERRVKILDFFSKYWLQATIDAFNISERTLYLWKSKLSKSSWNIESLNPKDRKPINKRKRIYDIRILNEITRIRQTYPNLWKDKIYPLLEEFCIKSNIDNIPSVSTIWRLIKDMWWLRKYPTKISHFWKEIKVNRKKVLRKPKDLKITHMWQVIALDSIEKFINWTKKYIITFEDIYSRFWFSLAVSWHSSKAAKEFFDIAKVIFPFKMTNILTDNWSEFMKDFSNELKRLHLVHYHTYPRTPKMNAHIERFNRTVQEEFIDYHIIDLWTDIKIFNSKMIDYLLWYNENRVHYAFKNKLSPLQFIMKEYNHNQKFLNPIYCKNGWTYTKYWQKYNNTYTWNIIIYFYKLMENWLKDYWPFCIPMSEESTKKLLTLYNEKIFLSSKDPRMVEYGNFREENMDEFVKDYVKGRCKGVLNNERN